MNESGADVGTVLIVDDELSICDSLAGVVSDEGWASLTAQSGKDALSLVKSKTLDLVFLDIWMPGMDGIETLQRIKEINPDLPVVIMSGHGTIDTAVRATKLGALEFIEKPLSIEKIIGLLERVRKPASSEGVKALSAHEMIGVSEAIGQIRSQIRMVAPRNSWVLITGENGTGKEVVARQIHRQRRTRCQTFRRGQLCRDS